MNNLKKAFERLGLTCAEAARFGVPYQTLYKQLRGERNVGVRSAIWYEQIFGIPRSELRPDIWPQDFSITPTTPPPAGQEQADG